MLEFRLWGGSSQAVAHFAIGRYPDGHVPHLDHIVDGFRALQVPFLQIDDLSNPMRPVHHSITFTEVHPYLLIFSDNRKGSILLSTGSALEAYPGPCRLPR